MLLAIHAAAAYRAVHTTRLPPTGEAMLAPVLALDED